MIVFTGTGRSGTALYSKLFNTYHEYNVKFLTQYFKGAPFESDPFADFEFRTDLMKKHLKEIDFNKFRDSSNPYVHFLDALYALNKDVKIVLGVRDGRDFVVSGITRGYHDENKYPLFSMIPTKDEPYYGVWPHMTPLEKCAWMWVYRNQKALDRLADVPEDNKLIVRLEDINNTNVVQSLEDFVRIKARKRFLKKKVNKNKALKYPPKEEWTREMNMRFNKIAGNMMVKLGYFDSIG